MRTPRTIRYVCRRPDFQADPRATEDIATPHQQYLLLSANILLFHAKWFQLRLTHAITRSEPGDREGPMPRDNPVAVRPLWTRCATQALKKGEWMSTPLAAVPE